MEDHSQAISFANSYFSLVDGLAPGLEDHLDENVVLDWFGRTIRGRENVAEFIKSHKVGSRHVFNSIAPVTGISYRKSQINRKIPGPKTDNHVSGLFRSELNFEKLSIRDSSLDPENNNVLSGAEDDGSSVLDSEGNNLTETIPAGRERGDKDLSNLSASEIAPAGKEAIERNARGMKNAAVKYVEANGHIEFTKKSNKRGTELQTWRRQSKLQIAYSLLNGGVSLPARKHEFDNFVMETDDYALPGTGITPGYKSTRLPSLGEITEISNNLVPNINNFGGYFLPSLNFAADRDDFLQNFNARLTVRNSTASLRTPHYVDNRLVFAESYDKPVRKSEGDIDKYEGNPFVFNYLIHLIIYQGNSRCRRSLTEEFDVSNKNSERFIQG